MGRPASRHPTEFELEILKILWRDGASSARHVVDALAASRPLAYTSVVTVMNIMARKGYLRREKRPGGVGGAGGFVYTAVASQGRTVGGMLRDLVERAFSGSSASAAVQLLETSDLSDEELRRIRQVIEEKARRGRDAGEP